MKKILILLLLFCIAFLPADQAGAKAQTPGVKTETALPGIRTLATGVFPESPATGRTTRYFRTDGELYSWNGTTENCLSCLNDRFISIPDTGELESFKRYFVTPGDTPILPQNPDINDFIWIDNSTSVTDGYGAPFTGNVRLTATDNVSTTFVLQPATRVIMRYDGTAWTSVLNQELSVVWNSVQHNNQELRPGHSYSINASADMVLNLPSRPFGVIRISLTGNSSGNLTINQHSSHIGSIIQIEDGTNHSSRTILNLNKGHEITIKGDTDPSNIRWYWNAPYSAFDSSQVLWHTDIAASDAVIGRLNLYPPGSSLTTNIPPTHVQNGRYSVAIGEPTGVVTGEITYISNGISGAGGAWVRQTEDQDTRILDNIQVGLRSSGTNAGSNIDLTFVDKDGVDYPDSAWAYSANLVQYSGGSATIITDKAQYNGRIGLGRNKEGNVKFYYTGSTPNGVSEITIDNTVATTAQNIIVTYQGTNYNDSFATISDLNTPLPWTTVIGQNEATDQAAHIVELTEYLEGTIISFREPDNTDPDYNKLFNWQVKAGQTVLDTEINDTSNETELIAIKPKLERFGIGTVTPEGLVPDWKPNTVYNSGDRFVAPMPINADFITNNGAMVGLNYIFQANVTTPNTITAFDDVQADSGNYDLIGVYRINGLDDRFLNGNGTIGLDPLNTLSNSAKNEYIHWTTTDTPQTIRLLPAPSFVTLWKDYTGTNIAQPTAANEDFILPANSQMWVHRVGNAISVTFERNESSAGGLKRITLQTNDVTFADATITIDYSAHDEQLFESELFVIGERTITFNAPTIPTGADRKTLIHRVFINANTADVTVTFPTGTWRDADTPNDATDIVIPSGENRTLELTVLDNDGNEYVRVLGSGGSNVPMVDGYIYSGIDTANSSFGGGAISFNSSSFNEIYDPKGLVDAGGATITIDSPEKAGAYMMALNVTSGTGGGAVAARVNGVNRLIARGEDGADSDATTGIIELNEGDVVTISIVSGNTTYGVNFTMSQVSRFIDQTQYVSSEQIIPVEDIGDVVFKLNEWTGNVGISNGALTTVNTAMDWSSAEKFEIIVTDADGSQEHKTYRGDVSTITGTTGNSLLIDRFDNEFIWVNNLNLTTGVFQSQVAGSSGWRVTKVTLYGTKSVGTVIRPEDTVTNFTQAGTPKNAGSTREYVLQWDGTQIVNTLAKEKWTIGTVDFIVDHLTKTMVVQGYQNITSSGSVNWIEAFANEHYTFAHDIREAQSERGVLRITTRSTTGITYVLYDTTGTGDAGSVVHFTITGRIN